MKMIFFASCLSIFISCKKNEIPPSLDSNNQVKATVILSTGDTIKINATGSKAPMGCSVGYSFVDGTNETNEAIYLNVLNINNSCLNSPGNYNLDCQYRPDGASPTTSIYVNQGVGSITFTTLNINSYAEGYFDAVCKSGSDSVIVNGSFKGHWD
jgi:hypothetical protein